MQRKTDDNKILELLQQGWTQKRIAEYFKVSPVAIHKRIKRILPPKEPESFQNLSQKEKKFALEVADGKTQTNAALASHDVTTRDSAKSLGSELMRKPDIEMAIAELMQLEGLSRRHRVQKLKTAIDHVDPNVSLKGLDQSWKLEGLYTEHHVHHIVSYADLTKEYRELVKEERRLKEELGIDDDDIIEAEAIEESEAEEEKGLEETEVKD